MHTSSNCELLITPMEFEESRVLYATSDSKDKDKIVLEPIIYTKLPKSQNEEKFLLAFQHWFKIPKEKLEAIMDIGYFNLFRYICVLDDIQDDSQLRECIPTAHSTYGLGRTTSATNYLLFVVLEKIRSLNHPEAIKVYIDGFLNFHREQGIEIYWRDNLICPTEEEFKIMTLNKVTGFFNITLRMMQLFSECKEDFTPLIKIMSYYFQLRDDYCNLYFSEYADRKGYCDDIAEGKFSFPIVHAIQNGGHKKQILDILRQKAKDVDVLTYCRNLLDKSGSFAYTRRIMSDLDKQAREEIKRLGDNPDLIAILDTMNDWKIQKCKI